MYKKAHSIKSPLTEILKMYLEMNYFVWI